MRNAGLRNTRILYSLFLIILVLVSSTLAAFSQDDEPLNLDWVHRDVVGIGMLLKLTPTENQQIDGLQESLKGKWSIEDENLGFGAHRVRFGKGYGYSSVYLDALTFEGRIAYYEIGVDGSSSRWPLIRDQIIQSWKEHGGPPFKEDGATLSFRRRFDEVFESYFRAVASELGEMRRVAVPHDLERAYEYLTSPMNNSYIGEGVCGLGGSVLEGKTYIDLLVEAKRFDLIENVLRGYNPGGRVFAAIALLRMRKQGLVLRVGVAKTIDKVKRLAIPVSTCFGCIVNSGLRARSVIQEFVNVKGPPR